MEGDNTTSNSFDGLGPGGSGAHPSCIRHEPVDGKGGGNGIGDHRRHRWGQGPVGRNSHVGPGATSYG